VAWPVSATRHRSLAPSTTWPFPLSRSTDFVRLPGRLFCQPPQSTSFRPSGTIVRDGPTWPTRGSMSRRGTPIDESGPPTSETGVSMDREHDLDDAAACLLALSRPGACLGRRRSFAPVVLHDWNDPRNGRGGGRELQRRTIWDYRVRSPSEGLRTRCRGVRRGGRGRRDRRGWWRDVTPATTDRRRLRRGRVAPGA